MTIKKETNQTIVKVLKQRTRRGNLEEEDDGGQCWPRTEETQLQKLKEARRVGVALFFKD